jgi:hypothetical protein
MHPVTGGWFPEVGDVTQLPAYSDFTEKRKIHPESIWQGATLLAAKPTHVVKLSRCDTTGAVRLEELSAGESLSALLHQTVVPGDAAAAKPIVSTVGRAAANLRGMTLQLGNDVYKSEDAMAAIERALV